MQINSVGCLILSCFLTILALSSAYGSIQLNPKNPALSPLRPKYRQGTRNPSHRPLNSAGPTFPLGPRPRGQTYPNPYPMGPTQPSPLPPHPLNPDRLQEEDLQQQIPGDLLTARAYVQINGFGDVIGFVEFTENRDGTFDVGVNIVYGLTPGLHGFHVHQFGDLSDGCVAAGPHYNPFNTNHGGPPNNPSRRPRHAGDFGNLVVANNGSVFTRYQNVNFPLGLFLGRSVIIHARRDDLGIGNSPLSRTTGDSGGRFACGVIALTGEF